MMVDPAEGGDVDDFEDDPTVWNPIASQLSKAIENIKKPDHWPRDFARSVKERQSALVEELTVKTQAMTADHQIFASQFQKVVAAALAPPPADGSVDPELTASAPPAHPLQNLKINHHLLTPATAHQPLHSKSRTLLEESKTLLAQYRHHLTTDHQQHSSSSSEPSADLESLAKTFAAQHHIAALAIAAGRRVADADIDDMLADRVHEVRRQKVPTTITVEEEALGREVLRSGRGRIRRAEEVPPGDGAEPDNNDGDDGGDGVSWGKVAHKAQRAVEKLVRVSNSGTEE